MKQPIKNMISIVLLVFYLAGFCGIHLLKHSCSTCNHSSIQLTQSNSPKSEQNNCSCNDHNDAHECSNQTLDCTHNTYCCNYKLIYLKNNPTTTLTKQNKAPHANETILFICKRTERLIVLSEAKNTEQSTFHLLSHSETDLNMLSTYRC